MYTAYRGSIAAGKSAEFAAYDQAICWLADYLAEEPEGEIHCFNGDPSWADWIPEENLQVAIINYNFWWR